MESLQPLVSTAIREIAKGLESRVPTAGNVKAPGEAIANGAEPAGARGMRKLDQGDAEVLAGGNLMLRESGRGVASAWAVYFLYSLDSVRAERTFKFRARLDSTVDSAAFVEAAYELIFNRTVDESGRNVYQPLVEGKPSERRRVLRILASSDEAQKRNAQLIIVPIPGPWRAQDGAGEDDDAILPLLLVLSGK